MMCENCTIESRDVHIVGHYTLDVSAWLCMDCMVVYNKECKKHIQGTVKRKLARLNNITDW